MSSLSVSSSEPQYSVIIPLFNESENIRPLLEELRAVMAKLESVYELLLIDDGSGDQTAALLSRYSLNWPECRTFHFENNQGQASALYFGIKQARGSTLVILDGDGQNDPRDIPLLLANLDSTNADMVMGVRTSRKDSWVRRTMSRAANAIRSRLLKDGVRDTGCGMKVLKREVSESFIPIRTLYSFMPALAVAAGFRVRQHPVNHRARLKGKSNYGLGVMFWRPLVDMAGIWWFISRRCRTQNLLSPLSQPK